MLVCFTALIESCWILPWLNKHLATVIVLVVMLVAVAVATLMNFPEYLSSCEFIPCCAQPIEIEYLGKFHVMFGCECVWERMCESSFVGAIVLHLDLMECLISVLQRCWDLLTAWIKITWATEKRKRYWYSSNRAIFRVQLEFHLLWKMLSILRRWWREFSVCRICKTVCIEDLNNNIQFKMHIILSEKEERKNIVYVVFIAMTIGCCAVCQYDFMSFENQRQASVSISLWINRLHLVRSSMHSNA